ncbi:hypothetical protein BC940DRAFT_58585 [Gongronella butleri]|nr:hypothetical protein BC940DRAFT_58585 [Gongronella butleri]
MPPKRRAADDDGAESSTGTARRLKQPRQEQSFAPDGSDQPVQIDEDVQILVVPRHLRNMKTTQLVKLLNDPNEPAYNEQTVPAMRCGNAAGCSYVRKIDDFMKVEKRGGAVKKTFYVMCIKCRLVQRERDKKHRAANAKNVERTKKILKKNVALGISQDLFE